MLFFSPTQYTDTVLLGCYDLVDNGFFYRGRANFYIYFSLPPHTVLSGCYDPVDGGFFYRGRVNQTVAGGCANWDDIEMVSQYKQYDYVGLDDNNFCRNTVIFEFEDRPWCYANGQKVLCGVPKCENSK